jgi:hypothetical protein
MITPQSLRRSLSVLIVGALPWASLSARVGEPQDIVERRLLQPNLGRLFFQSKEKETPAMDRARMKEQSEQQFNEARKFLPADSKAAVYWKSAIAKQLSNENGWKVFVFYTAGRSVLEGYQRVGEELSEFEVRAILSANQGGSTWRKTTNPGGGVNGIGHDFELEDGSLRAKQKGNWLMVFSTRLDEHVIAQQKIAKEEEAKEAALKKVEQQKTAPVSVIGL